MLNATAGLREPRDSKGRSGPVSAAAAAAAAAARSRDATGKSALRFATDDLGGKYTGVADDAAAAEKKREAAMLFSVAESALAENEDAAEALKGAQVALDLFKEAGDTMGVADSARLLVHAYKAKADLSYWEIGEAKAEQELQEAEDFAKSHMVKFKDAEDKVGEAAMQLSLAEVTYLLPKDYRRRAEAAELAEKAKRTFAEVGATKLEALSSICLFRIAADKLETSKALALATEAFKKLKALGEPMLEARALCALAEAKQLCSCAPDAIKAVKAAVKIFKEGDSRRFQAASLLLLAEICLLSQRFKEALGPAKEALAIFEELQYGKGFRPATMAMIADAYTQLGETSKAIEVAKEGLAKMSDSGDKRGQVLIGNGLILAHIGCDEYDDGDVDEALKVADSSLALTRELGDKVWESQVLHTMLQLHVRAEDKTKATEIAAEAGALFSDTGDASETVLLLDTLATMQEMNEDFDAAVATRGRQRELCQKMEDKVREGIVVLKIAAMWAQALPVSQEHMDMAMSAATQAQGLFQEAGDPGGEAVALMVISEVCLSGGEGFRERQPEKALEAAQKAQTLFQQIGDKASEGLALQATAQVHLEMEKPAEAVAATTQAVAMAKKSEDRKKLAEAYVFSAQMTMAAAGSEVFAGKDQYRTIKRAGTRALKTAREALNQAKKLDDRFLLGSAVYAVAQVQVALGQNDEALKGANQAVELFRSIRAQRAEADAIVLVAEVYLAAGDLNRCVDVAEKAVSLAQKCKDVGVENRAYEVLGRVQTLSSSSAAAPVAPQQVEAEEGEAAVDEEAAGGELAEPADDTLAQEPKGLDLTHVQKVVNEITLSSLASDEEVHLDAPLMETGMDSLSSVAFRNQLNLQLQMNLPAALMFDYPSQRAIAEHIVELSKQQ